MIRSLGNPFIFHPRLGLDVLPLPALALAAGGREGLRALAVAAGEARGNQICYSAPEVLPVVSHHLTYCHELRYQTFSEGRTKGQSRASVSQEDI